MRADRLVSIMLLLQTRHRMTAGELAAELEVSERTIYRDMEALSGAGVPVVAERGVNGGWSLVEGYQTRLTGLKASEIQALFVANPARLLADLGLEQASEAALMKLLAALPAMYRQNAEYVQQRIYIDTAGWKRSVEDVSFLPVLQTAVWDERQVQIIYQRGDDVSVERLVDPLGLVAKGNIWYLVGGVGGELRTFRISRVREVNLLDVPCQRPADFDLAAYWQQSAREFVANLPVYPALLRVTAAGLERMRWWRFARVIEVGQADAAGWSPVTIHFELPEEACEYVAGCGGMVEVLEPDELRAAVIERALGTLHLYQAEPVKT
jgi:predicted DNA-binding transcriptional regulator YafY